MPRRISDYPDAFTGWNFISSIGSIISVAATALFLHIVYLQLVKGKAIFGYPWAVPQLFSDYLRILKDKCAPGLEWALHSPPKPHAFTSLPLQSSGIFPSGKATGINKGPNGEECPPHTWESSNAGQGFTVEGRPIICQSMIQNTVHHVVTPTDTTYALCVNCGKVVCKQCYPYVWSMASIFPVFVLTGSLLDLLPTSIVAMVSSYSVVLNTLLSTYKIYKLPSKVRMYLSILKRIVNYIRSNKIISLSILVSVVIALLFTAEVSCDAPRAWGLYFQDSASPQMEALVELHEFCV